MGCCDPRGFEKDPVPFHYGEFTRTSLVFVIRLPTNALPPQLHLNHEVLQQSDIVENQQARQQALEASGAWEESLSWLFPGGISAGGLLAAGGAVEKTASPEGFHRGHSSGSGGTAAAAPPSAIECFDSLRGLWKVAIDKDCSLQLSLWYGTTAALHLTYDSNACGIAADVWQLMVACTPDTHASSLPPSILHNATTTAATAAAAEGTVRGAVSCMPSASVSLEPPYEPRWPEGRSVRRCRLIGVLSARPCGCLSADDAAANGDADREAPEEPHACETREFPLPDSLVSLYRLHAAAALPPKESSSRSAWSKRYSSCSSSRRSAWSSPLRSASGGFELENMSRSSSVERRYPLRRSRQMGSGAASPSALKRRRGNGSGGPQRGAPRGPGAAVASSVPTVRLPTEQEEAALPYLPLQLTLRPQDQEQRQHASTALQLDNAAAPPCPRCSSSCCGAPVLLLAADWELGALVSTVPPEIKPARRYARLLQRASKQHVQPQPKQHQQETLSDRLLRVTTLLLQQLNNTHDSHVSKRAAAEGLLPTVAAGAFTWAALRGLPLWSLYFLQDLFECL
ncbi:uncharacterized protein LOC34620015 [Cyclospora cayetanensis]|uniref:Uncharacterized protein LOC34620015 n=1 Tax=Cyclospora cayetanensis TaxID=88456 RepID=A0A6P6S2P9_9EIME|nr:uncharacterized protein LOC34620015 [Cyclospora cayetanensis]